MRRFLGLAVALVALIAAGFLWTRDRPVASAADRLAVADADPDGAPADDAPLPDPPASNVTPADREARRFARYDKDASGAVSRDEYLANRRKGFGRLDRNGDGRLDFEEYATVTVAKFAKADRDADGRLAPKEFATTALKRKAKPACVCAPAAEE